MARPSKIDACGGDGDEGGAAPHPPGFDDEVTDPLRGAVNEKSLETPDGTRGGTDNHAVAAGSGNGRVIRMQKSKVGAKPGARHMTPIQGAATSPPRHSWPYGAGPFC